MLEDPGTNDHADQAAGGDARTLILPLTLLKEGHSMADSSGPSLPEVSTTPPCFLWVCGASFTLPGERGGSHGYSLHRTCSSQCLQVSVDKGLRAKVWGWVAKCSGLGA